MSSTTEKKLLSRIALVTGAANRIGRAISLALAAEGAHVVVHYLSSEKEAHTLVGKIKDLGNQAFALKADLSEKAQAETLLKRASDRSGPVDILVNNASIFPANKLADVEIDEINQNLQVNALAPFILSRALANQKRKCVIINLLDARMVDYDASHVAYHLSKRMLFTLTRMMALEFAPAIRVNAVAPGLVLPPRGKDESYLKRLADTNPLNRHGSAAGVAEAVLFLVTSDFVTGQVIFVDGGRHMKGRVYD